jgi:phosphohistidine phosphatase
MKTLYLVRHAKSSWKHPELSDLERPLSKRGKIEAPFMGKLLMKKKEVPELIISSPAKRALSTAKRLAEEMEYSKKNIVAANDLYMADLEDFNTVITEYGKSNESIMILGHNPGLTTFANYISSSNIDNIPTSGVVRIDLDIASWKEISNQKGNLVFFEYPKKYAEG